MRTYFLFSFFFVGSEVNEEEEEEEDDDYDSDETGSIETQDGEQENFENKNNVNNIKGKAIIIYKTHLN